MDLLRKSICICFIAAQRVIPPDYQFKFFSIFHNGKTDWRVRFDSNFRLVFSGNHGKLRNVCVSRTFNIALLKKN